MRLNRLISYIFPIAFLLLLIVNGFAQNVSNSFYFGHLTNNDGLSSSKVNCIYEDQEGFIWLGTEDGLNLFDGISVRVFKHNPSDTNSIVNNSIYAIAGEAGTDNLWIGTRKGISYFDKSTFQFKSLFNPNHEISEHVIFDLKTDTQGKLWIGSSYGLYCYLPDSQKLHVFKSQIDNTYRINSNIINHIFIDSNHRILISNREGVELIDAVSGKSKPLFTAESLKNVMHISKDHFGTYWICTDEMGLYTATYRSGFELSRFTAPKNSDIHQSRIHSVVEDHLQNLFFVARDKGLFYFNRKTNEIDLYEPDIYYTPSLNSKALITSLYSSSGILWLGTFNRGVNILDSNRKMFHHYKINYRSDGLFNNNIRSFFQDSEGMIWIGTKEGGGLSRFSPENGTFENFKYNPKIKNSFSSDYILTINELNSNELILGTLGDGVDIFNKKTKSVRNIKVGRQAAENKIYSIFKDLNNQIWAASLNGLFFFKQKTELFEIVQDYRGVKCFAQTKPNEIWMGTRYNGLVAHVNNKFLSFNDKAWLNPITTNEITALRFANDSILWIGTINGLNRLNTNSLEIETWSIDAGLPSNRIAAIEIDNFGHLWISTANGLSKFTADENTFRNYFVEDGLQGNDFEVYLSLKDNEGRIYFGGGNGFNVFNPHEIKDNPTRPKINFTNFKIANQEVLINHGKSPLKKHINRTENIVLNYNQADFTFEYVAINYTSPENNKYKYLLEGYDHDWNFAGKNNTATYTNIPAGDYVFKVTGANNDNNWNTEGRSINITVLPPPWKSKWAYILYLIVIGFMVMGFYFVIVNRIEQQNLLRLERHEREKIELINQLKLKFFTNISHEFRTPLTLISSPLSKLMNDSNLSKVEQGYLFNTMHKNVKRLLRLMKQLMDFRKLENQQMNLKVSEGNLPHFIADIIKGFEEYATTKTIGIKFSFDENDQHNYWFDSNILDSIIFNLLSNALKFSPAESTIQVTLKRIGNQARIKVIDNGIGIAPEKIDKIFDRFYSDNYANDIMSGTGIGLSFSQNLIILHKGEIKVESNPGVETCFTVMFPANKEAYVESETSHYQFQIKTETNSTVISRQITDIEDFSIVSQKKEKLLIVEDNNELRIFLKKQFTAYQVLEAEDGVQATEIALKEMPDIIISDIMMPNMDGVQFCSNLKNNFITSHIPIILLTAQTATEQKIKGIESGADAYVEKPFEIDVLEAQIKNLLKHQKRLRKRFAMLKDINPEEIGNNAVDRKFLAKAEKILNENIDQQTFSVEEFGEKLNMSRSQLFRKFKAISDETPSDYIRNERLKLAKKLLLEGNSNVNEIAFKTGFSSSSHFISTFKKHTGFTPKEFSQN